MLESQVWEHLPIIRRKKIDEQYGDVDLDELAEQCRKILNTEYSDRLDELYRLGGTSGGARPKIMTTVNGEEWIIKFPAHVDGENAGKMEYDYSCCAKKMWYYNE